MSEEEKEAIEQEFQYALDEILSLVKGETATAIVVKEQSMILLFKKLLLKIDKLQKENKELKEDNQKQWEERCRLTFKLDDYISKDKIRNIIEDLRSSEWYDDYETIQGTIEDIYLLVKE